MYVHQYHSISPQKTTESSDLSAFFESTQNKLMAQETIYPGIPPSILRRMGKAVRMGIGAAIPIAQQNNVDGIIIGTANGGMEDCIKFLNQIKDYDEGMLTPGNFVQSTPNAIAAQIGLLHKNKGYNITHVHRGLAFENALLDAAMLLSENPHHQYLLGGVDEISDYNYNIDWLDGCFKKEKISNAELYNSNSDGTIAGEGAAMFLVNNNSVNAVAKINAVQTLHTTNEEDVRQALKQFLQQQLPAAQQTDLLLTGENGDARQSKCYIAAESLFDSHTTIARFKHLCGEFPTASAIALWLVCYLKKLPQHMIKRQGTASAVRHIIICNNYRGLQHGFMHITLEQGLHNSI
ncbi:MAG: beta-ketoacyl synthase chain length factor [Chitinophagaceae bacterium]|nr:beta-ketoacyl synthase chain length factor [Chitinophagaceae bacterium]